MIKKIISGGQTGADRAALDFAIEVGIPHGGWVPKGRLAEYGPIPGEYNLQEMPTLSYSARTEQNVTDSDGTLIFSHGNLTEDPLCTKKLAEKHKRACLHIDFTKENHFLAQCRIKEWIEAHGIKTINVTGPRASKDPRIYEEVLESLIAVHVMVTQAEEMSDPERISPPSGKDNR